MRYAQKGLVDACRAAAAGGLPGGSPRGATIKEIAHDLRVTEGSVRR
jgi:hypothetical protein